MARDAFIVLGYTMEDICNSSSGFGFLFGEANLERGVGRFSFARYADGVSRTSARLASAVQNFACSSVNWLICSSTVC